MNFTDLIDELDRVFVGQLYDHRSNLIHLRKNNSSVSLKINPMQEKVETKIISPSTFNRQFKELRDLSKEYDLSISYVLIWLLQKTNDSIIDIQYGLKEYMEQNNRIETPFIYIKGTNNEATHLSENYWKKKNNYS